MQIFECLKEENRFVDEIKSIYQNCLRTFCSSNMEKWRRKPSPHSKDEQLQYHQIKVENVFAFARMENFKCLYFFKSNKKYNLEKSVQRLFHRSF